MSALPLFKCEAAVLPDGRRRFVIVDSTDPESKLHVSSGWLSSLHDLGKSENTIRAYGSRLAAYLTWSASTSDWRSVGVPHFRMWLRVLSSGLHPGERTKKTRKASTVASYMPPLVGFYSWADEAGFLTSDVAHKMKTVTYLAAGTPGGGEYGRRKAVLVPELKIDDSRENPEWKWISDENARRSLATLELPLRDRFLIDLLLYRGLRIGEALSLFDEDLHMGGGSAELECSRAYPHFHVGRNRVTENGSHPKSGHRVMEADPDLVDAYANYVIERQRLISVCDDSRHVFVNLYTNGPRRGQAMSYSGARRVVIGAGKRVGVDLSGPHMLRHTFATALIRGLDGPPADTAVVQDLLGHRSIDSTRIYSHDREQAGREAMIKMPARPRLLKKIDS